MKLTNDLMTILIFYKLCFAVEYFSTVSLLLLNILLLILGILNKMSLIFSYKTNCILSVLHWHLETGECLLLL